MHRKLFINFEFQLFWSKILHIFQTLLLLTLWLYLNFDEFQFIFLYNNFLVVPAQHLNFFLHHLLLMLHQYQQSWMKDYDTKLCNGYENGWIVGMECKLSSNKLVSSDNAVWNFRNVHISFLKVQGINFNTLEHENGYYNT